MSDSVVRFMAPTTGANIALNRDLNNFVWLDIPSPETMDALLVEHEAIRLAELWKSKLLVQRPEGYLEGFAVTTGGALRHFTHRAVNVLLSTPKIRGLAAELHKLTVAEQEALLLKLRPTTRSELEGIATTNSLARFLGNDLRNELAATGDVAAFVNDIIAPCSDMKGERGIAERNIEILVMLRAKGYLLFPASFTGWLSTYKWRAAGNEAFAGPLAALMNEVAGYLERSSGQLSSLGQVGVLMSSMSHIDDLSTPLIEALEDALRAYVTRPGHAHSVGQAFRILWNQRHPENAFVHTRTVRRKPTEALRTSGDFTWLALENEAMVGWVEPLASFVASREANSKQAVIADLNYFCDFLLQCERPPTLPELVVRQEHIRDVTFANQRTLMHKLESSSLNNKRRNRILSFLREFYGRYRDWLLAQGRPATAQALICPVAEHDGFVGDSNPGKTYRTALPGWLLQDMKEVLSGDDFAFPKRSKSDWVSVFDNSTGKVAKEWWPGTATCLLLLLELPLRSHQARWLDSGVFDERYYDPTKRAEVVNVDNRAVAGRRQACLRQLHDTLRQERWPGLFVNTNKTALYDGKSDVGYEIPYLNDEMCAHLWAVREWTLRYLPPLVTTVTYLEEGTSRTRFAKTEARKLPKVAPLFRDPQSAQRNRPPSYNKVSALYLRVLAETEKYVKRKRGVDIELTTVGDSGELTWKYDLHTLRVSGISAMLENGVPLEVVSQFVAGHHTLVMTLWYAKNSPGQLREAIAKARTQAESDGDFVGGREFLEQIEKFAPYLLSKNAEGRAQNQDDAFFALKKHTGLWTIATDGICPGTSCVTGGEWDEEQKRFGPVPGGRRCGLCRYWITGPAFILGQVAETNNLIYQIRKKGLELKEAKDLLIDLEDSDKRREARQLRGRIELLERELSLDISEWQARYEYAMSSSGLLDGYVEARRTLATDESLPAPYLTTSSAAELKVTLQEADEFMLLEHVTQMCEFMPGFKNREAVQEKHLILSKVLAANGLPPMLLTLEAEQAEEAANLMSSMMMQYLDAQERVKLLMGTMKLSDSPTLESGIRQLTDPASSASRVALTKRRVIPISKVTV